MFILDEGTGMIKKYIVIVEKAEFTLQDLIEIWKSPKKSEKFNDYYSPFKLAYIFLQTLYAMKFFHSFGIFYGDMKP